MVANQGTSSVAVPNVGTVSRDQCASTIQGRLPHTFGRERHSYTCGTLFIDHASKIFLTSVNYQIMLLEPSRVNPVWEALAKEEPFTIETYHTGNRIFVSTKNCTSKQRHLTFSVVGLTPNWPTQVCCMPPTRKIWSQAVDYAVWVFNRLPSVDVGLSPNELWSKTR